MKKLYLLVMGVGLLNFAPLAFATDPFIHIGTQYMLDANIERTIPIFLSSSLSVRGMNFAVQIDDGGIMNSGFAWTPSITNVDIIGPGTIFHASNTGSEPIYLNTDYTLLPPGMVAKADVQTASGTVIADGVMAYLTVNPSGAAVGSMHSISLQNVAANYSLIPLGTELILNYGTTVVPNYSDDGWIKIVSLHDSIWNAVGNGNWTDASWTNPEPPFPNYTTNAILNTPRTVTVTGSQEANSLNVSNNGQILASAGSSLSLTTGLNIGSGALVQIEGAFHAQDAFVNGTLNVFGGGTATLNLIDGNGIIHVGGGSNNAVLQVSSLRADSLIIGNSGFATVPEPGCWILLVMAVSSVMPMFFRKRFEGCKTWCSDSK
jgi:hypothetical protein